VSSRGPAADAARAELRQIMGRKGHAVDIARVVRGRLRRAFATGELQPTEGLEAALADLDLALEQDEGQKLGGKSAEAARFILRAIDRQLERA
jgi:hypothetical protein